MVMFLSSYKNSGAVSPHRVVVGHWPAIKVKQVSEPPRVCRRLQLLREWSHDERIKSLRSSRPRCVSARCGWCWSTAREHTSQWAAIASIAAKIGCTAQTLSNWVRQAERDQGKRPGHDH